MRSVLRQGHRLRLYCYEPPEGVPDGVELADASEVVSPDRIVRYARGSYSLFSNLFRYELQRQGLGTWLDCDAYLLKPLDGEEPYLIGEYEPGAYNSGVLRIPADSPLFPLLLAPFDGKTIPYWMGPRARIAAHWRRLTTGRTDVSKMPWGTTGPGGLTAAIRATGVDLRPVPPEILYPVRWQEAQWVADPAQRLEDRITERTVSIHLWNECIKQFKEQEAAPGSFLARLQAEGR